MSPNRHTRLRTGFTTGAAAAAAAKGALHLLLKNRIPDSISITLLTGDPLSVPVHASERLNERTARCSVIKDGGDDPDITNGAEIGAVVTLSETDAEAADIRITGGEGVGKVTKPGLEVPPGEAAINPGPRKMILAELHEILGEKGRGLRIRVEIFVPDGERLAGKTLNARLGILGGISILGTTGLVRPMSHEAYIATIASSVSVAEAMGIRELFLTTGRRSERFARSLWPDAPEEAFIQIGDFFQKSLDAVSRHDIRRVTLAVFFGKALKMAQGVPHTHAAKSRLSLEKLSLWISALTGDNPLARSVAEANTARHAFGLFGTARTEIVGEVGKRMTASAVSFAGVNLKIRSVIFDFDGHPVFDSAGQFGAGSL